MHARLYYGCTPDWIISFLKLQDNIGYLMFRYVPKALAAIVQFSGPSVIGLGALFSRSSCTKSFHENFIAYVIPNSGGFVSYSLHPCSGCAGAVSSPP